MSISSASVKRPVFTAMVTLIVVVLGFFSLGKTPVDLMPDITEPVLTVTTEYENASPLEVEELITKPLERSLAAITGINELRSTSREGVSRLNLVFDWGHNLEEAANDVRDRIDRTYRALPDDIDRPTLFKFDTSTFPIMMVGVSSQLHPVFLKRFVEDEITYRFERSPGVATANAFGGLDREIHVDVDHDKAMSLRLDLSNLLTDIRAENLTEAGGDIDRGSFNVAIRTRGEFENLTELGNIVVAYGQGDAQVRLRDIASIEDSWARQSRVTRIDHQNGLNVAIFKQSGSNTISVAEGAQSALENINRTMPTVRLVPMFDSSTYIKQSISSVATSALQGGLLAVLVILAFLQNVRSTLILAAAIPISIIATFMAMFFSNLTINILTLGALALGVGMLVDNAIVVLENIFRLRSEGLSARQAAIEGTNQISGAIIASTLTTLAVFLPMIFLEGIAGVMFRPFSLTIVIALVSSLAVALTLAPMMAGQWLTDRGRDFGKPRFGRRIFKAVETVYLHYLQKALRKPKLVLFLALALLALSAPLVPRIGTEFSPKTDEGSFSVNVKLAPGTRVEKTVETVALIEDIIAERVPERTAILSNSGGGSFGPSSNSHTSQIRVRLTPIKDRDRSVFEIMDDLRPLFNQIPGVTIQLRAQQSFFSMGGGNADRIRVELRGHDLDEASRLSDLMKRAIEEVDGITDVQLSTEESLPEEIILIDRARAADAHLTIAKVVQVIKTALGGSQAGNYREGGREYAIVVSLKEADQLTVGDILNLTIINRLGQPVVLGSVARAVPAEGPTQISRRDQTRVVTLSADYTSRSMGEIITDIEEVLSRIPLPTDFSYNFAGEAEEQAKAFQQMLYALLLAVFLVYMVMACQFEQLKGPLVVMFSVPFAAIGVILSHFLTATTFSVNSFIGIIMLAGIVVNNAIILLDQTNMLRRHEGWGISPALIEAGRRRLRPILMTTMTTILGLVPLALGFGEGGESQAPLARTVIGGLTSSTLITLFLVPAVYKLMAPKVETGNDPEAPVN